MIMGLCVVDFCVDVSPPRALRAAVLRCVLSSEYRAAEVSGLTAKSAALTATRAASACLLEEGIERNSLTEKRLARAQREAWCLVLSAHGARIRRQGTRVSFRIAQAKSEAGDSRTEKNARACRKLE